MYAFCYSGMLVLRSYQKLRRTSDIGCISECTHPIVRMAGYIKNKILAFQPLSFQKGKDLEIRSLI